MSSINLTYLQARNIVADGAPCVVLQLGAEASTWAWGSGGAVPEQTAALNIGIDTLAQRYFRAARPSEPEVELAIEEVEEIVMPWRRALPLHAVLVSSDPYVHELASHAGLSAQDEGMLTTDTVEAMFNQWADEALGGASYTTRLPTAGTFAAALLVVRELLHHLSFAGIFVQRSRPE